MRLLLRRMASNRCRGVLHCSSTSVVEEGRPERGFCVDKHPAFRHLQLKKLKYEGSFGRMRQHVNPLSVKYQTRTEALNWNEIYANPELPLIIDVGTGYGRFPILAATRENQEDFNYLGTEIRQPLVGRANFWAESLEVSERVHFVFCNITISLETLLKGYPGSIHGIYIQFPDPLFKKKQTKRHIVQSEFIQAAARVLTPGGLVFMQSDVESCAVYMRKMFEIYGFQHFAPSPLHQQSTFRKENQKLKWDGLSWLNENPIGSPTEREVYNLERGMEVFRLLLTRI